MGPLKKILVPVDGSPPSLSALEHALALARDGDAKIDVLHVEGPGELGARTQSSLGPDVGDTYRRAMDEGFARARQVLGDRISRQDVSGDPLRTIVQTAAEGHYDLVVIGTHGRTGRIQSLLGSVAAGVVRNASCPVLTVREPGESYESFSEHRHHRPSLAEQARH
jgi:nucleotide-binding universal stress UspA family protein